MKINKAGINLIKKYEGFRSHAYRDAVGVWTIGYGHTSMAGTPNVSKGLKISRRQGETILARDVEKFARAIQPLITVELNENQFSALVSFAYNVGVGGFKRSSVLKRVNARQFDAVPHRLSLWVKAGGRTLRGLVARRAAEADLFLASDAKHTEDVSTTESSRPVKPISGKPAHKSTTNLAAVLSAIAGLVSSFKAGLTDNASNLVIVGLALVIIAASLWIMRERWNKIQNEGV